VGLNSSATYPVTITVGSTTYNIDALSFGRKCTNKPIVINKPMTQQNGTNMPETLYKDLKNISNSIIIVFNVYSNGTSSPIAVAEDMIDKFHKEAPPVVVVYQGVSFDCVFITFGYDDRPQVSQKWRKNVSTYGGVNSPSYLKCTLSLTKGTKRI